MGGKINAYLDCASPYSYIAFVYLRRQRKLLKQYGVEIDFIPFFLGAVNQATGNSPPFSVKAKALYGPYDLTRASTFFDLAPLSAPPFFPILSLLPQRAILAVKSLHSASKYEQVYAEYWPAIFNRHIDISRPEELLDVLKLHLSDEEAKVILEKATSKEFKDQLSENTKTVIESGGFGAPWFVMENYDRGVKEPLFGSDRWAYMFRFLGVEIRELVIVDRTKTKGEGTEGKEGKGGKARL